jgi:hypothetical protein
MLSHVQAKGISASMPLPSSLLSSLELHAVPFAHPQPPLGVHPEPRCSLAHHPCFCPLRIHVQPGP